MIPNTLTEWLMVIAVAFVIGLFGWLGVRVAKRIFG